MTILCGSLTRCETSPRQLTPGASSTTRRVAPRWKMRASCKRGCLPLLVNSINLSLLPRRRCFLVALGNFVRAKLCDALDQLRRDWLIERKPNGALRHFVSGQLVFECRDKARVRRIDGVMIRKCGEINHWFAVELVRRNLIGDGFLGGRNRRADDAAHAFQRGLDRPRKPGDVVGNVFWGCAFHASTAYFECHATPNTSEYAWELQSLLSSSR